MTDPLTGKELVQKSYDYIDKLTKECAKTLLEEYNKTHKKFQLGKAGEEIGTNIGQWFEKRDKNVRLALDRNAISRPQPTQVRLKFRGNTKDTDFILDSTVGLFVVPGSEVNDGTISFAKTLAITADKVNFTKRKT